MVDYLQTMLPIVIYMLLIALIIIGIIIGIKIIITMNKVEKVVDNVQGKISALDSIFNIIELTTGKINGAFERVFDFATRIFDRIFLSRKERNDIDEENR